MTAYRLARLTEIHETQIGKLKNGKARGITFKTLDKLCEALNCEPGDLLTRRRDDTRKTLSKRQPRSRAKAKLSKGQRK